MTTTIASAQRLPTRSQNIYIYMYTQRASHAAPHSKFDTSAASLVLPYIYILYIQQQATHSWYLSSYIYSYILQHLPPPGP